MNLDGVFQLAATIAGIALVTVLVTNAGGVAKIVDSASNAYTGALRTAMGGGSSFYSRF